MGALPSLLNEKYTEGLDYKESGDRVRGEERPKKSL